jgi:hypothetical protein
MCVFVRMCWAKFCSVHYALPYIIGLIHEYESVAILAEKKERRGAKHCKQ